MSDNENTRSVAGSRSWNKVVILTGAAGNIGTYIPQPAARGRAPGHDRAQRGQAHGLHRRARRPRASIAPCMVPAAGDSADPRGLPRDRRHGRGTLRRHRCPGQQRRRRGTAAHAARHPLLRGGDARPRRRPDDVDSAMNLLAAPWNMARAAVPHMRRAARSSTSRRSSRARTTTAAFPTWCPSQASTPCPGPGQGARRRVRHPREHRVPRAHRVRAHRHRVRQHGRAAGPPPGTRRRSSAIS
jgi:hypothetical protein